MEEKKVHAAPELVKVQEEEVAVRQAGSPLCSLPRSGAPTGQGYLVPSDKVLHTKPVYFCFNT